MSRPLLVRVISIVAVLSMIQPSGVARAAPCWRPPVSAPISDPFRLPNCRWCPGNRGVEYATSAGATVTAVATGRVSFVGSVAGTGYVVVRHGDGRRVTYGNVTDSRLEMGDLVVRGMQIGTTAGRLHLGLRRNERYVDPTPLIGRLVYSPRLIPSDGARPAPAPAPRWRCAS